MAAARVRKRPAPRKTSAERTEETRRNLIDSAMETITELGYYRATSNEIARRAGVTWGAIQHHFGTREALILAILEAAIERVIASFNALVIRGRTLEERLGEVWDTYFAFYGDPRYLAILQILLDLSRDPAFGKRARAAVDGYTDVFNEIFAKLAPSVWVRDPAGAKEAALFIEVCWGLAVSSLVRAAATTLGPYRPEALAFHRDVIIHKFATRPRKAQS